MFQFTPRHSARYVYLITQGGSQPITFPAIIQAPIFLDHAGGGSNQNGYLKLHAGSQWANAGTRQSRAGVGTGMPRGGCGLIIPLWSWPQSKDSLIWIQFVLTTSMLIKQKYWDYCWEYTL